MREEQSIETECIHAGEQPDPTTGAVVPPIYQTTTFQFEDSAAIARCISGEEEAYFYSRYGNPTLTVLEEKMSVLEHAEAGLSLASGNAANTVAILFHVRCGDHVIATRDVYGGTYAILTDLMGRMGVETTFVDTTELAQVDGAFRPNTRLVFVESPTNPTIRVSDIGAIADAAHSHEARLVVDNTFATPFNQNPILLGADMVTHSATKFLNGHSDVTAGLVLGREDDLAQCRELMKATGASLNPIDAWFVIRGLKTLAVRMERHNSNAMKVAEFLCEHPGIESVIYPGLPGHPQRETILKQMRGYGGMVSFVVTGGWDGAAGVIDRVRLAMRAVSLGSIETLITQPAATSHNCVPKEERERAGIVDGLIRLSVGIENVEDIIVDLDKALHGSH